MYVSRVLVTPDNGSMQKIQLLQSEEVLAGRTFISISVWG